MRTCTSDQSASQSFRSPSGSFARASGSRIPARSGACCQELIAVDALARSAGRFFFHVMASLAQLERELMAERTRAGLDAARRRGRVGGRKRRMTTGKVKSARQLLKSGMAPREVTQNLGVSLPTLYR
jgi:DNA invertase Pin-like site-specific DNA recombinase